jgi:hypothetical protein
MSVLVPFTADDSAYTFECALNGVSYRFDVRWNERGLFWAFDLYRGSDDTLIVAGLPILLGDDILGAYRYLGIGGLFAVDMNADQQRGSPNDDTVNVLVSADAGAEDLGTRVKVFYYTPAELTEAGL